MTTYFIGDVHGCLPQLEELLQTINYSTRDTLWFLGDLIGRGPASYETLSFVSALPNAHSVLGNHDLYALGVYAGVVAVPDDHAFALLSQHSDSGVLMDWLRAQPLMHVNVSENYCAVHAGIPPQWSLVEAWCQAREFSRVLQSDEYIMALGALFDRSVSAWSDEYELADQWCYCVNALTRLRFCTMNGTLDLTNKTAKSHHADYRPWFDYYTESVPIFFGHWAAHAGRKIPGSCVALDTGCVWGNQLTAYALEEKKRYSVLGWTP